MTGGGAPGPGRGSGGGGAIGSTMMSKSETFQGPGGFLTPSNPPPQIPQHQSTGTAKRKKERHTHTRMHSTEQKRHKRLEVKKTRNQLHNKTVFEEREPTAGNDGIHAVIFKRNTKPLY